MDKIRVGMVGAGFAADFHTQAFEEVCGVQAEVVAVTSQREKSRNEFAEKHGIANVYEDMCTMLAEEDDLDVVDLCVPTYVHAEYIVQAAQAGLDVIVEKPLTGYCGEVGQDDEELIGDTVPKSRMMEWVLNQCEYIEMELQHSETTLMYAENWVYAPSVQKARRLIEGGSGPVMRMVAEESHSGSHASYAKYWSRAGGGSLLRTGSHPVGGVLYLKQAEGISRDGAPIRPKSVMADVGRLMDMDAYDGGESALTGDLADCEDWGAILITFEDGSVAQVSSSDVVLGGIYNYVKVFCSRGRIECNLNPNDQVMIYGPDEDAFGEEYIAEKLSSRAGWNFASPDEHWASGYPQEIQDFAECVAYDREPLSGWTLARDVVAVIYAAYVSAEEGRRVEVPV